MKNILTASGLHFSRLAHGYWRLAEWNMVGSQLERLTNQLIELGITTVDHADIYGDYSCEKIYGKMLSQNQHLREKMQLVTKCGIALKSNKFPERNIQYYNYSTQHIINSVENSLKNLCTDYIDVLLLHRPAPFFNPVNVAKAFEKLKQDGKVLHFGVSNFTPGQYQMLQSHIPQQLGINQVEISPLCVEHFENGNIDFFLQKGIVPMAWSPMAGGRIVNPVTQQEKRVHSTLNEIAKELNVDGIDKVAYAWLLKHPARIVPLIGSGKIARIKRAVSAQNIDMNLEQWYKIFIATTGEELP